jgi:hypothetical protein
MSSFRIHPRMKAFAWESFLALVLVVNLHKESHLSSYSFRVHPRIKTLTEESFFLVSCNQITPMRRLGKCQWESFCLVAMHPHTTSAFLRSKILMHGSLCKCRLHRVIVSCGGVTQRARGDATDDVLFVSYHSGHAARESKATAVGANQLRTSWERKLHI